MPGPSQLPGPSQAPVAWATPLDAPAAPLTPPLTPRPPLHHPKFVPSQAPVPPWRLAANKVMEQCRVVEEAEQDKLVSAVLAQAAVPMATRT